MPVLRKSELPALQKAAPPFGGFVPAPRSAFGRLFTSPGRSSSRRARAPIPGAPRGRFIAMGFRPGDVVLNTFGYHLTPGGFIMDSGARALGCVVIPAGPGNTEQQLEVIEAFRPSAIAARRISSRSSSTRRRRPAGTCPRSRRRSCSGAAFPKSLQEEIAARGVDAYQAYATADLGVIAYETPAREGMVVNEDLIVEIVRPGTGDPVPTARSARSS